jgi:hypothetical protein
MGSGESQQPEISGSAAQPGAVPELSDWSYRISLDQTFQLMDSILPLEVCLYHQVLPLSVEGHQVNLGMVNPTDTEALTYIQKLLASLRHVLIPRKISPEIHRSILSAYLHYDSQHQEGVPESVSLPRGESPAIALPNPSPLPLDATITDSESSAALEDTPTAGNPLRPTIAVPGVTPRSPEPPLPSPTPQPSPLSGSPPTPPLQALPSLDIHAVHLTSPIRVLALLPAANLIQELLARVLAGGIGRLFFERKATGQGRVLWSQDGIVKAVLEGLDASLIQGAIDELKKLHSVPLQPVQKTLRVEIERFYQQNRVLLRLQVMPGAQGEEATLQVLRGTALKFYQQQQVANLSRDVMNISQQLQQKLSEIHASAIANQIPESMQLDMVSTLNQCLNLLSQHMQDLKDLNQP